MFFSWLKKVWNRVRGHRQRGIQSDGKSKYPKRSKTNDQKTQSNLPKKTSVQQSQQQSQQQSPKKEESDIGLYHAAAPPAIVIESETDQRKKSEEEIQLHQSNHETHHHDAIQNLIRKPGGELQMIIERERASADRKRTQDHLHQYQGSNGERFVHQNYQKSVDQESTLY